MSVFHPYYVITVLCDAELPHKAESVVKYNESKTGKKGINKKGLIIEYKLLRPLRGERTPR